MAKNGLRALQIMKEFAASRIRIGTTFDYPVLSKAKIIEGCEGQIKCEIPVTKDLLNGAGALHGGAVATIVDSISTLVAVSVGNNVPGVSIDLSVSYMKAAFLGDTLMVEAHTSHSGKQLAFLTVDIMNKETGALLAQGKHTKYMGGQKSSQTKAEESKESKS